MFDPSPRAGRTLLLGVGNDLLADDGVGLHVARAVRSRLPAALAARVDVEEAYAAGFELIDYLQGYARAVIVDAIQTEGGTPGDLYRFDAAALRPTAHLARIHGINLAGALAIADQLQLPMPAEVVVLAVEADDVTTFREELSPAVAAALPAAVAAALDVLAEPLAPPPTHADA